MASGDDFAARIMGIALANEQRKQEFQAQLQAIAQASSYAQQPQQQQQAIHQGQLLYPSAAMGVSRCAYVHVTYSLCFALCVMHVKDFSEHG